jgi:hypothetical protein
VPWANVCLTQGIPAEVLLLLLIDGREADSEDEALEPKEGFIVQCQRRGGQKIQAALARSKGHVHKSRAQRAATQYCGRAETGAQGSEQKCDLGSFSPIQPAHNFGFDIISDIRFRARLTQEALGGGHARAQFTK